jgi:hypothetical protein
VGAHAAPGSQAEAVSRFDRLTPNTPEEAASRILRGVERREPRILIGRDARQIDILQRLRPATYWKTLAKRVQEPVRKP